MSASCGLTPIRVRGKRKTAASSPGPTTKIRRTLSAVLSSRSHRQRVTLQSLPFEILEKILLYSLNPLFPRASPIIGVKLSRRSTLLRLFVLVFRDTWDYGFKHSASCGNGKSVSRLPGLECPGDPHLQTYMLHLVRVDIDFILQAQQVWADRYARHQQESMHMADDGLADRSSHFNVRRSFEQDYFQATQRLLNEQDSYVFRCGSWNVHPHTRLPIDLVTGPWDEEQSRRLFWLVRGGILTNTPLQDDITSETWSSFLENLLFQPQRPNLVVANCLLPVRFMLPRLPPLPQNLVQKCLVRIMQHLESPMSAQNITQQLDLSIWLWHLLRNVFSQDDCLLESPDLALRIINFEPPAFSTGS
ncbi:hypothetical protein CDD81_5037 [Ophiocordyceps australis]|uniref:Uncharacterized protein n=1 Tax=Ophiocordyceps australis TaxID=1399860 RepID=A0A2C5YAR1_9HYPO|nr:hypothetical protein CDD81_5037 [Ophiocordyceps australis]